MYIDYPVIGQFASYEEMMIMSERLGGICDKYTLQIFLKENLTLIRG